MKRLYPEIIETVGDLKAILKDVPDDYKVYIAGTEGKAGVDDEDESLTIDDGCWMDDYFLEDDEEDDED